MKECKFNRGTVVKIEARYAKVVADITSNIRAAGRMLIRLTSVIHDNNNKIYLYLDLNQNPIWDKVLSLARLPISSYRLLK